MKRALTIIMMMAFLGNLFAQDKSYMLGVGRSSLLDTYLSPEHFSGTELNFIEENTTVHRDSVLSHTWQSMAQFANVEPRSELSNDLIGMLTISYGLHWRVFHMSHLAVSAGGAAEGFIGGIYNTRNGNNPAQLKAGVGLAPSVRAEYHFRLWRRDMCLNYQARMPLLGLQFSPAYGQSYYEIFNRGNYDHNICLATPANALSYSNIIALDIPVYGRMLRLGYLGDYRQAELNGLRYHNFTHSLLIGWRL